MNTITPLYILQVIIGLIGSTIFSTVFIVVTDTLIKLSLMKDSKNYIKFKSQLALVKLWTVPLMVLGIATIIALIIVTFGLV